VRVVLTGVGIAGTTHQAAVILSDVSSGRMPGAGDVVDLGLCASGTCWTASTIRLPVAPANATTALRQNVLANIAKSQAARASSNFGAYVARETQVLSGYSADAWSMTTLKPGSIVYGGVPGQSAFYTDFGTVRASGLNAQSLFESTQVAPHPVYGYRPAVQAYRVTSELTVPGGSALNNPAFGAGGGTQFFIPNYNKALVPIRQFPLSK
jgi:filamentous hemagglutinin